jgi:uncharacterized membrane protein YsdA (DUF1294 family)
MTCSPGCVRVKDKQGARRLGKSWPEKLATVIGYVGHLAAVQQIAHFTQQSNFLM